jgi:hypothetical protein
MTGETFGPAVISGNEASNSSSGGGVYVAGETFTLSGGTIGGASTSGLGNTDASAGGVFVDSSGTFTKTGGTVYGDTDNTHTPGSNANTATATAIPGKNGHAVLYMDRSGSSPSYIYNYYYRNETLTGADNISTTTDTLPGNSGETVGKRTMR